VDDEERTLELPSMEAPRIERMLWLGVFLATVYSRWLSYDAETRAFSITQFVKDFPAHEFRYSTHVPSDQDSVMTYEDSEDGLSDMSPIRRAPSFESAPSELQPTSAPEPESPRKLSFTKPPTILQRKSVKDEPVVAKDDVEMKDVKQEFSSPSPKPIKAEPEDWPKAESYEHRLSPVKVEPNHYESDPRKMEVFHMLNAPEVDEDLQQ
jgi:hypothetical protein